MAREIARGNPERLQVALTFDAGASAAYTPAILATLREQGVRVTIFLTGSFAERNPELVKQMVADGHELANHTYTHPDLTQMSDAAIRRELRRTEEVVQEISGATTKPYFRPPYGARDNRVRQVAAEEGYRTIS
jgi:peptidoglycan/xylan/chitin deacetylase (PgdA/CDA1 family)